jgi:predicted glycosyltransferase/peptidoglycan/xylan/chitin deacetylase (PgdA/CDA1 family)
MIRKPLHHAITFWKPLIKKSELDALARYADPEKKPEPGINVWKTSVAPAPYVVAQGQVRFSIFAAVHPIAAVPDSAEVIAEIRTDAGDHHSYVLWNPSNRSLIMPFDPNAATEAFWYEEYVPRGERTVLPKAVLSVYYAVLRSLLPRAIKYPLRRLVARRAYAAKRFLEWPIDDSLDRLQRFLIGTIMLASDRRELKFGWFWPNKRPWAVVLTHDVETADGLAHLHRIADIERARGVRSSFNLVPLDYPVSGSIVRGLRDDGFEIGVHGYTHDGLLFSNWTTFAQRLVTINEFGRQLGASGFRSPATYRNQHWFHMLGFEYDSSLADTAPFEPQAGGCASLFPFQVDDGLIELPMTLAQDHTLFGLLGETNAQTWLTKLRQIKKVNGMGCVLTHPDPAPGYVGMPENEEHYTKLLDTIVASGAWVPLPRELARWWRTRMLTPADELDCIDGSSVGTAVLTPSGQLEVVPPLRTSSEPPSQSKTPAKPVRPIRVWIDMANSPHVQFFGPIIKEIEARGHSVLVTARDYAQTVELLDRTGLRYTALGQHGGKSSLGKLVAIESRARVLASYVGPKDIDIALHHNSYAQAIAARYLRIPSITLMDYEFQPANHLSFRLSDMVLVPESIPRGSLTPYGAGWRLRRYPGLKEDFYVASMLSTGSDEVEIEGLDSRLPLFVLRPPPDYAIYHRLENALWCPLLEYLAESREANVLVLPRTDDQAVRLAKEVPEGILIADRAISPVALLSQADGVITAGGTMAREAAAIGIPAYTLFAGRQGGVDTNLIREGRLVELKSKADFHRILLRKNERPELVSIERERERVEWLVDIIVLSAGR